MSTVIGTCETNWRHARFSAVDGIRARSSARERGQGDGSPRSEFDLVDSPGEGAAPEDDQRRKKKSDGGHLERSEALARRKVSFLQRQGDTDLHASLSPKAVTDACVTELTHVMNVH